MNKIQKANQFLFGVLNKKDNFETSPIKLSRRLCKVLNKIEPNSIKKISKTNSNENFQNFISACSKIKIIDSENIKTTDNETLAEIVVKLQQYYEEVVIQSPKQKSSKMEKLSPKSPKREFSSEQIMTIISNRIEQSKKEMQEVENSKLNDNFLLGKEVSKDLTSWSPIIPQLKTRSAFDSSPFSSPFDSPHIQKKENNDEQNIQKNEHLLELIKQKFASDSCSFDASVLTEYGKATQSTITITNKNITMAIQGGITFTKQFNINKPFNILLSLSKTNIFKLVFSKTSFVVQMRNETERYIFYKVFSLFQTYQGEVGENNLISGKIIGIEEEIDALARKCKAKNQAVFPVRVIVSKTNTAPAVLRISQNNINLSSMSLSPIVFSWNSFVFRVVEYTNNALQIQAIPLSSNEKNEQPKTSIVLDCETFQKRRLISKCISEFTHSDVFGIEAQRSETKNIGIQSTDVESFGKNNGSTLIDFVDSKIPSVSIAEFSVIDGEPKILLSNSVKESLTSPLLSLENQDIVKKINFQVNKLCKENHASFQVKISGIQNQSAKLTLNSKQLEILPKDIGSKFVCPFPGKQRLFLNPSKERYFVLQISSEKRFILKAKSSFDRDLIRNIFWNFNQPKNSESNQSQIWPPAMTCEKKTGKKEEKPKYKMQNKMKKFFEQNYKSIYEYPNSRFQLKVLDSFNDISGTLEIGLFDDHFEIEFSLTESHMSSGIEKTSPTSTIARKYNPYSLLLINNNRESLIGKLVIDEKFHLKVLFPNQEVRSIFASSFLAKKTLNLGISSNNSCKYSCTLSTPIGMVDSVVKVAQNYFAIKSPTDSFSVVFSPFTIAKRIDEKTIKISLQTTYYVDLLFKDKDEANQFFWQFTNNKFSTISQVMSKSFKKYRVSTLSKSKKFEKSHILLTQDRLIIINQDYIGFLSLKKFPSFYLKENDFVKIETFENSQRKTFVLKFSNPQKRERFYKDTTLVGNQIIREILNEKEQNIFQVEFFDDPKGSKSKITILNDEVILDQSTNQIKKNIFGAQLLSHLDQPLLFRMVFANPKQSFIFSLKKNEEEKREFFIKLFNYQVFNAGKSIEEKNQNSDSKIKFSVSILNEELQQINYGDVFFEEDRLIFKSQESTFKIKYDKIEKMQKTIENSNHIRVQSMKRSPIFLFKSHDDLVQFLNLMKLYKPKNCWVVSVLDEEDNILYQIKLKVKEDVLIIDDYNETNSIPIKEIKIARTEFNNSKIKMNYKSISTVFLFSSPLATNQFINSINNHYIFQNFFVIFDDKKSVPKTILLKIQNHGIEMKISEEEIINIPINEIELFVDSSILKKILLKHNDQEYILLFPSISQAKYFHRSFYYLA
ncbi:hypothetical protein M0811_08595 [Anaeramoeba ignava]|uniref:Uncharacterized protein n=1 Tax=Anaeramoeba ignava TaxID=1746090 RepID=A0A9Q0LLA1_ANAIG|nr:hypothetical protein M0811_08595 [Anaeramoeba ignava]